MRSSICWIVVGVAFATSNGLPAAKTKITGLTSVQVAREDSPSIVQLAYWGEDGKGPKDFNEDGTGFLVGRDGYFVTAAHVLRRFRLLAPFTPQVPVIH